MSFGNCQREREIIALMNEEKRSALISHQRFWNIQERKLLNNILSYELSSAFKAKL
jgi:hypothetical protein